VLGGGDKYALAHEGGGVGDLRDIAARGGDLKVIEIRATENDAGTGGSGDELEKDLYSRVKANTTEAEGRFDGVLELGLGVQRLLSIVRQLSQATPRYRAQSVANLTQY
jgi:hypothetical protein